MTSAAYGVNLFQSVDVYQRSERAVKYALLFIALTLKFSRAEDDPAGLSHCAQPDVRRYALRRPAACLEYCAAARGEIK
jgi:Inner membrane protein CreD